MTKGEETRQEIIAKAAPLFNQRGFAGCSMGDVMTATGLGKGGLYRHFASKEDLAAAVLAYSMRESARLRVLPPEPGQDGLAALRTYADRFATVSPGVAGGCPLMNGAVEYDDGNPELRALVREGFAAWKQRLAGMVERGQAERVIRLEVDAAWVADSMIAALEGGLMLSRIQRSQEPLRHALKTLALLLDSVAA